MPKKTFGSKSDLVSFQPFYHNFICRNLGVINSIDMLCLTKIENSTFLEELNRKSYCQRPVHRRLKYQLDLSASNAYILPDLLSEPISCEIKVNRYNECN